jgi:Domain of unknown function (DUF4190)
VTSAPGGYGGEGFGSPAGYGGPGALQPKTNSLALASIICGGAQVFLGPLITIPAIVLGHMARKQIRSSGENGDGLALAGLLLGWAGLVTFVILAVLFVVFFTTMWHSMTSFGSGGSAPPVPTHIPQP